ncbi:MAG: hypothetical protein MK220_05005, partial [Candidatus Poseidoniia archaeon]|nr:hypothetical protein [Candidatus Poseidoniia archaeon]
MAVSGFRITGIEARRHRRSGRPQQVRIDHNTTVLSIRAAGKGRATVEYRYTVTYGGLGMVQLDGEITYASGDGGTAREVQKLWEREHKMPDGAAEEVHNAVLSQGSFEVFVLARKLNLPPPVKV